jgi:peptidoglycan hydrolase-like amidase
MYGGKYIGAYYCHSNGGRTYSCEEVWGSKRPYLIARKDEWTVASGAKKNGHGIGLS